MLARLQRDHPLFLRADFQQYYGLNIDGAGISYPLRHAADLAACLPREARCARALDPAAAWGDSEYLLALVADAARDLFWLLADSKHRESTRPRPVPRPHGPRQPDTDAVSVEGGREAYLEELARLRKEAAVGN